ncbi:glutamate--tRNA ligase [Sporolactobacillus pectinivorans]|uniref:glutamate--tRNA ligase n=1 Tax=Sporolactobacillus pectinivorans TaxID=1591408 RepID=UPI000C263155|nr:glutamate--tRNA ligase [Sporolactobacillus pectinivorans]
MTEEVRVRYAPSPTGFLHIGNARTAIFNYLFARHAGGKFVIRIEDTDQKRNVEGGEESQLKFLKWLGLEWDESVDVGGAYGPYRQMERLDIYKKYWQELLDKGLAYKCYCTEEELKAERETQMANKQAPHYSGKCRHLTAEQIAQYEAEGRKPTIRFRVTEDQKIEFDDIVKGHVSFNSNDVSDFVIVKQNGVPTYNFAVVVDDHLMKMTHVLRGEEHISNTPKQIMLFNAFGWQPPVFGHMTLIVNESHKKLSKRDNSIVQFIEQYKNMGFLPEALFNFIALLGWSPKGEEEIFSREDFIKMFDADRLSKSPAMFDKSKLEWMNGQYINKLSAEEYVKFTLPFLIDADLLPAQMTPDQERWATRVVLLYQEQLHYGAEIVQLSDMFFNKSIVNDDLTKDEQKILAGEQVNEVLSVFNRELKSLAEWKAEAIAPKIKVVQKETKQRGWKLYMPIRVVATGSQHGPELPEALELLGKDIVLKRMERYLDAQATV